jgi:coenzyme F420-reducing hydrogenase alpha subunit
MHDEEFELEIKNISKIEGHTHIDIKAKNGKVSSCKLKISENKRFFTTAIKGAKYSMVPVTMSRICGTCSSAHVLCATEAVERAFGVKPSEQTFVLRNLLMYASQLRDHAMHLYFFCLPDLFNKDSVLDFNDKELEWVKDGFAIKAAGNLLATVIGGRPIHPHFPLIGGFSKIPEKEALENAKKQLIAVRPKILKIIDLFYNDKSTFKRKTNYVALVNNDFNYLKGVLKTAKGTLIKEENYGDHLQKVVLPYSTALGVEFESKEYMVGSLARMNLNKESLNKNTARDAKKYLDVFPSDCIFRNNLAQAIEMLHDLDASLELLDYDFKKEAPVAVKPRAGVGVGVVEAPRGTLYYHIEFDSNGVVKNASICIPTQQNIIHLEKDIAGYVEQMLAKKMSKTRIGHEVEKMIRAYDPCMSCATHFLKINWI